MYIAPITCIRVFFIIMLLMTANGHSTGSGGPERDPCLHFTSGYVYNTAPYSFVTKVPVEIDVGIFIWYITDISVENMAISFDMYLEFHWPDYRVDVNVSCLGYDFKIPEIEATNLWKPFLQYRNCKGCSSLVPNPKAYSFYYNPTSKKFWTITRNEQTFNCDFHLEAYPMDQQVCAIQIENYYDDNTMVRLLQIFNSNYSSITSNQMLSEFHVLALSAIDCSRPINGVVYSCVELRIKLKRYLGFYILTTYIPTSFLVVVSWVSFWLPVDNVPGRVTLGMTSLLTLATRLDLAQKNLPAVSYVKAIDVWICCCLFSVFATLIEFAFANYIHRTKNAAIMHQLKPKLIHPNQGSEFGGGLPATGPQTVVQHPSPADSRIDRASRVLFPLMFIIFLIAYWSFYV